MPHCVCLAAARCRQVDLPPRARKPGQMSRSVLAAPGPGLWPRWPVRPVAGVPAPPGPDQRLCPPPSSGRYGLCRFEPCLETCARPSRRPGAQTWSGQTCPECRPASAPAMASRPPGPHAQRCRKARRTAKPVGVASNSSRSKTRRRPAPQSAPMKSGCPSASRSA